MGGWQQREREEREEDRKKLLTKHKRIEEARTIDVRKGNKEKDIPICDCVWGGDKYSFFVEKHLGRERERERKREREREGRG